jgi:hypothetical protein
MFDQMNLLGNNRMRITFFGQRFVAREQLANYTLICSGVVCGLLLLLLDLCCFLALRVALDLALEELLHPFRVLIELQLLLLNIRCLDATLHLGENAFAELCSVAGHVVVPPLM